MKSWFGTVWGVSQLSPECLEAKSLLQGMGSRKEYGAEILHVLHYLPRDHWGHGEQQLIDVISPTLQDVRWEESQCALITICWGSSGDQLGGSLCTQGVLQKGLSCSTQLLFAVCWPTCLERHQPARMGMAHQSPLCTSAQTALEKWGCF